ncbi:MAG: hypothetical protein KDB06_10255 [Ilumatobacter sp.]|nr:hypothetical protein [Ilumatobacter sp.]
MTPIELARDGLVPLLVILAALAWSHAGAPTDAGAGAGMMDAVPDSGIAADGGGQ